MRNRNYAQGETHEVCSSRDVIVARKKTVIVGQKTTVTMGKNIVFPASVLPYPYS